MPGASDASAHGPADAAQPPPAQPPDAPEPALTGTLLAATPTAGRRWTDLRKRLISAAVLAPLAIACLWFGAQAWMSLVAVAAGGLAIEWVRLCGRRAAAGAGLGVPVAVFAAGAAAVREQPGAALLVLLAGAVAVWVLAVRLPGPRRAPRSLAAGVPYVGLAAVALIWLRADPAVGRGNTLFLLLVVWASDIGAYAFGRLIGGPLLAPAISPAKTWAGAAGGLLVAIVTGWMVAWAAAGPPHPARLALVAGGLAIAAQAGDLLESYVKRRFGVKDSGRLIPGHGGLLDRLDGVLTAAPAAALLALLLGRGVNLWQ